MRQGDIERLLAHDFSAGTEAFREDLLGRCLAELGADADADAADFEYAEIDDGDLDMLAAAGNIFSQDAAMRSVRLDGAPGV